MRLTTEDELLFRPYTLSTGLTWAITRTTGSSESPGRSADQVPVVDLITGTDKPRALPLLGHTRYKVRRHMVPAAGLSALADAAWLSLVRAAARNYYLS